MRASALNAHALARSYRHTGALYNPGARARITAGAALAGWHFLNHAGGWWQR